MDRVSVLVERLWMQANASERYGERCREGGVEMKFEEKEREEFEEREEVKEGECEVVGMMEVVIFDCPHCGFVNMYIVDGRIGEKWRYCCWCGAIVVKV